jgi:DNA-binding NarL/FixJ family response regulator
VVTTGDEKQEKLTARELAVLKRFSLGDTRPEIAKRFGVSVATVHTYLNRARQKLRAKVECMPYVWQSNPACSKSSESTK